MRKSRIFLPFRQPFLAPTPSAPAIYVVVCGSKSRNPHKMRLFLYFSTGGED